MPIRRATSKSLPPFGCEHFHAAAVDADASQLVLLAAGGDEPDVLLVYDIQKKEVVARKLSSGNINRIDTLP